MFDYVFYRLFLMYKKKEKVGHLFSATAAITCLQIVLLFSIALTINFLTDGMIFSVRPKEGYEDLGYIIAGILPVIMALLNYLRFKKKLQSILLKYRNYKANKWFKNWMIFFIPILMFAFPFTIRAILLYLK